MAKASLKNVRKNYYFLKDYSMAAHAISKREALYKLSKALGRVVGWSEVKRKSWFALIDHSDHCEAVY